MADLSDVITYVGVPLAVLDADWKRPRGVVIWGGGVIEVSLPRYSVTPLDRTEDEYWTQCTKQSVLKGGTWTVFNWNQLVTGYAMQRIQYSSDLKVPQAEIHLEELFDFMLDRAAVPDAKGIHMPRVSRRWTPTGTCLMLCPDTTQTALRVSMPDYSDGVLSFALQWKQDWNKRDPSSLPPGWMRLEIPSEAANEADKCSSNNQKLVNLGNTPSQQVPNEDEKIGTSRSKDSSTVPPAYTSAPTSVRFNLSSLPSYPHVQIRYPMYEYNTVPLGPAAVPLDHWAEREERREREAISSPKLDISLVMNAALGALAGDGLVINPESQDKEAAEAKDACQLAVEQLLVGVWKASTGIDYSDNEWALKARDMLHRWRDWIGRDGMNKEDLRAVIK
ncbi:MAG: hypothetical protein Q9173_006032 [Seirophora scorigena]